MTRYYKAAARGVTVTRSSTGREYSHAVITWLKPRAADQFFPNGLPARPGTPSFCGSLDLAHREQLTRTRHKPGSVDWCEIAEAEEIDAKAYRALKMVGR